jgi:hypothetical protein
MRVDAALQEPARQIAFQREVIARQQHQCIRG